MPFNKFAGVDETNKFPTPVRQAMALYAELIAAFASKSVETSITTHVANVNNPHGVTKTQVGLGNVDNTSDASKPISTATQTALNVRPKPWAANTAYLAGDVVVSPRREIVFSKSSRTSGASFDNAEAAQWAGNDNVMMFSNLGFAWSGGQNWDAGTLSVDTSVPASSQVSSGTAFAAPGSLSGTIKFLEPGIYDVNWDVAPNGNPGQSAYVIQHSGTWPGPPDNNQGRFGHAFHQNTDAHWETSCTAVGIRVPQAGLEIRLTGYQANGTTDVPRVKVIKRSSI